MSSTVEDLAKATPPDRTATPRIYGVATATVIDNCDRTSRGRVKLRLPWLPGREPWARVATLMAGPDRGTFFIPQVDDEVLVAFENGDVNTPYVVGCLWNGRDAPPESGVQDASKKHTIRTRESQQLQFDDDARSITLKNNAGHEVTLKRNQVAVIVAPSSQGTGGQPSQSTEGQSTLTLDDKGNIAMTSKTKITLKAQTIELNASTLTVKCTGSADIDGGLTCSIKATAVGINS